MAEDPSRFRTCFDLAALQAWANDDEGLRRTCAEMRTRFHAAVAGSCDGAEQFGKTCLLLPGGVDDPTEVAALLESALEGSEQLNAHVWYLAAGALADYRTGNHAWARTRARRFFEITNNGRRHVSGMVQAICAIAEHRLGNAAAAQEALEEGCAIVAELLPQPEQGHFFQGDWSDWIRCLILLWEAEATLADGDAASPAEATSVKSAP
jgi:hypothetical protein